MKTVKLTNQKNSLSIKQCISVAPKSETVKSKINNGSFEYMVKDRYIYTMQDKWYHDGWYASDAFKTYGNVTDEMSHSGKQCLKCDFRNTILMKFVDVEPHTDYVFSFYYYFKSDENSRKTPLINYVCVANPESEMTACNGEWWEGLGLPYKFDYYDGFVDSGIKTVHDRWTRVDFEFNSKQYSKVKLAIQYSAANHETAPIYLDDIVLYDKASIDDGSACLDVPAGISVNSVKINNDDGVGLEYELEIDREKLLSDFTDVNIKELGVEVGFENGPFKGVTVDGSESILVTGIADDKVDKKILFKPYAILSNGKKLYSYYVTSSVLDVLMEIVNNKVKDEQFVENEETVNKITELAKQSDSIYALPVYNDKGIYGETISAMNMGVYHLTAYMKDDAGRQYTQKMIDDEMDRLEHIGITAVRSMFRSTWAAPEDEEFCGWNWESENMRAMYKAAKDVKDRGIDIILTCGWLIDYYAFDELPYVWYRDHKYLRGDGEDFYGESDGVDFTGLNDHEIRIKKASLRYGEWVSQGIKAFFDRGLDNVKYALVFTEPRWNLYTFPTWSQDYVEMVIGLNQKLKEHGLRDKIQIIGPNQSPISSTDKSKILLDYVLKHIPDKNMIDIYSSHTGFGITGMNPMDCASIPDAAYDFLDVAFKNLQSLIRENGCDKNLFSDELFVGEKDFPLDKRRHQGPLVVNNAIAAIKHHIYGISYWSIFDQLWPNSHSETVEFRDGVHCTGMANDLKYSYVPHIEYYAVGLFGRYVKGLNQTIETDFKVGRELYYTMLTNEDGIITVAVANTGITAKAIDLEFKKDINQQLNRHMFGGYITVPDERGKLAGIDKTFDVKDHLFDVIPACSVVIYTNRKD